MLTHNTHALTHNITNIKKIKKKNGPGNGAFLFFSRLLEGGEPDPVRALKGETRRTTKLPLLTESHRALPLLLILSAREL